MTYAGQPARPTTYRGIEMRSRLEAKFAAYLDDQGYLWHYEPRAYAGNGGQYLPDFEIATVPDRTFVEVRPTLERAYLAMTQMQVIWESEPGALLVIAVSGGPFFSARRGEKWECWGASDEWANR